MSAGVWLVCFACGLRHTPRPDKLCPRCHAPSAEPEPDAAGAAWRPAPPRPLAATAANTASAGARIAGWAMIVNGLVGAAGAFRVAAHSGTAGAVAAALPLVGAALGAGVVAGSELARKIAIVLAAIALPGLLLIGAVTGAWAPCGAGALLCLANLALLVGDPGPARLVPAALALAGGCAASVWAAADPAAFAAKTLASSGLFESEPVTAAAGADWRMTLPPGRWYRAKKGFGPGLPPGNTFIRPDGPAWAAVLPVPSGGGAGADMDRTARLGSEAVGAQFDRWRLIDVAPLEGRGGTRVLHGVASKGLQEIEVLCGLFPNGPLFHVVVVGAAPRVFEKLRDELTGVLASFRSETVPMPPAPTPYAVPAATLSAPRAALDPRGIVESIAPEAFRTPAASRESRGPARARPGTH